jgi:hypothetical protein
MSDTVDYVSGISRLNDFGGTWDNFAIRGFSSTDMGFLVNGFPGSRGYNPPRDTATVERFEFLNGPASAVYGSSEPGGTINIVTKKPEFTANNTAEFSVGSRGLRRAALDTTGALGSTLAYRVNVMAEEGDSRTSLLSSKRHLIAPALTWKIDDRTTFNYEAEFLRADTPLDRGLINVRGVLGTLPTDRVLNEPSDGNMTLTSNTHQATLERKLNDGWRARLGASYKESTFEGYYTEATSLAADNRTLNRQATWRQLGQPVCDAGCRAQRGGTPEGRAVRGRARHLRWRPRCRRRTQLGDAKVVDRLRIHFARDFARRRAVAQTQYRPQRMAYAHRKQVAAAELALQAVELELLVEVLPFECRALQVDERPCCAQFASQCGADLYFRRVVVQVVDQFDQAAGLAAGIKREAGDPECMEDLQRRIVPAGLPGIGHRFGILVDHLLDPAQARIGKAREDRGQQALDRLHQQDHRHGADDPGGRFREKSKPLQDRLHAALGGLEQYRKHDDGCEKRDVPAAGQLQEVVLKHGPGEPEYEQQRHDRIQQDPVGHMGLPARHRV